MTTSPIFPRYLSNWTHPGLHCPESPTQGILGINPKYGTLFAELQAAAAGDLAAACKSLRERVMFPIDRPVTTAQLYDRELHKRMLGAAEPYLTRDLATLTADELEAMIQQLHEIGEKEPCGYRQKDVTIRQHGLVPSLEQSDQVMEYLRKNAPDEIRTYHSFHDKLYRYHTSQPTGTVTNLFVFYEKGGLTPQEKALMDKYLKRTPRFGTVPMLMKDFVQKLLLKLQGGEDPITIAAFAHMQIAKIHPYGNGNGRLARLIMNLILASS